MGHLNIVSIETIEEILNTGYVSTRGNLKSLPIKTISDIFSDMLAVRTGDFIFPWIVKGSESPNIGFKYVFKASGHPIYVNGNEYPVKIPIASDVIIYENPLPEAEALDLFRNELLWNAIGKKSLGRGRSLTHQSKYEDNLLISLLNERNQDHFSKIQIQTIEYPNAVPIHINVNQYDWENGFVEELNGIDENNRISELDLSRIPWTYNGNFSYEKTFEAWLIEHIDTENCIPMWELLGFPNPVFEWFGNYLPYGVAGSNIDAISIVETPQGTKIFVFELKNIRLNLDSYESVTRQISDYSVFIEKAFSSFAEMQAFDVIPVIISPFSKEYSRNQTISLNGKEIRWLGYEIVEGKVNFKDHLCILDERI